jgi:hypothetical protein
MAKKPRTPAPPRKVQAPKVRQKHASSSGGFSLTMPSTNTLIGAGLVAIAAIVIGWLLLYPSASSGGNVSAQDVGKARAAMTAAGCTFTSQPANPAQEHMGAADQKVVYDTFPAASGIHHPTPALLGNYRIAADPRQVVHVLEHGGVAIWTGPDISAKDRGALDAFYDQDSNGLIITPLEEPYDGVAYPKHKRLGGSTALSTWTTNTETGKSTVYLAICPSFDEEAFAAFRDSFRGRGPERFPVSEMRPGS